MKKIITFKVLLTAVILLLIPTLNFAQHAPPLGTVANFVLFSSDGAVSNTGISQLTGNVGSNVGSSTNFGNVNGIMCDQDAASAQCAVDLLKVYDSLNIAIPTFYPSPTLGNGDTLIAGVYSISAAATLNLNLILNAKGNANAVFIFQIGGAFSTSAGSKVKLINGAQACKVFWKVEGQIIMATGTTMRGTVIANNAAIEINTGDTLEGRALTTDGGVTVAGVLAYTPIGCGSPVLTGPTAPNLNTVACFAIFSSDGAVTNSLVTHVVGDVGTNVGLTTGFNPLLVTGKIDTIPNSATAACGADLLNVYNYLDTAHYNIELLYPAQFGNNLVLTPHTYVMNGATTFTDTLYLNALNDTNAVFILRLNGALSTSTYSKVILINGAKAKNIYWMVNGAVQISDHSVFNGTMVSDAAVSILKGVAINGRILTTVGTLITDSVHVFAPMVPGDCITVDIKPVDATNEMVTIYPNPFNSSVTIMINDATQISNYELRIYNVLGEEVMNTNILKQLTTLKTSNISSGIYFYKVIGNDKTIQTGKLISQ
ncbi:MAG: ice-binding family protein [Bacteroidales bacterium]|jgi:hypothetical protein